METSTLFSTSTFLPFYLAVVAVKHSHARAAAGRAGRVVDGSARDARRNFPPRKAGVGGVATSRGFQHPRILSSCPLRISGKLETGKPQASFAPSPAPRPGTPRARRCHYTSRDTRTGPVLQEASRRVLIKGHNKTDLRAH